MRWRMLFCSQHVMSYQGCISSLPTAVRASSVKAPKITFVLLFIFFKGKGHCKGLML